MSCITIKCSRCKKDKPELCFNKNKNDEYYKGCIDCLERVKRHNKICYKKNGDLWKDTRKRYALTHKEQVKQSGKKYLGNLQNREKSYDRHKIWIKENPDLYRLAIMLCHHKQSDEQHNRFNQEEFITKKFIHITALSQNNKCVYCDVEMTLLCDIRSPNLMTVERVDNKIGHIITNCVLSCYECNMERGDRFSFTEFKAIKAKLTQEPPSETER